MNKRNLFILFGLTILLVSCSSQEDATTYIATGKVTGKEKVENNEEIYYKIIFKTHLENFAKEVWLPVKDENVWNLIQKDHFYRITFDLIDGMYSPIKEIHPTQVDQSHFEEVINQN